MSLRLYYVFLFDSYFTGVRMTAVCFPSNPHEWEKSKYL